MPIILRDYQETLVADIRAAMARYRKVLAVSPTGSGKTIIFAYISAAASQKQKRVYIVVHRAEILDQISRALLMFNVQHGRIQPGFTPSVHPVQIGMIQTLSRRIDNLPEPDLLVIDEAHHAISASYEAVLQRWGKARVLGVTATPQRLDGRGLGAQFDVMIEGPTPAYLIDRGFLADFDYLAPPTNLDLSNVPMFGGDYEKSALSNALEKAKITGSAVDHYRRYLQGRPSIAFCCRVIDAEKLAKEFSAAGYRAASIDGKMSAIERSKRLNGLADGSLNILTSADLIGEGVDVPAVAGALLLRPTKSLSLHLQQIGRTLRPKTNGERAIILDHVGNIIHGTPKTPRVWALDNKKHKAREAGIRQCKICYMAFDQNEKYECGNPDPGCIFKVRDGSVHRQIETVDGELQMLSETPAWAGGADILLAKGDEWKSILHRAVTYEQLAEIARVRGYARGWIHHIMQQRRGRAA